MCLFLMVSELCVGLQCVIVAFPGHTPFSSTEPKGLECSQQFSRYNL